MAKIIGITGRRGSGKDTIANYLKTYYARNFRSIAFADPMRAALKAMFDWDDSYFEHPKKDEPLAELGGKSPRDLMKPLGTEWGREMVSKSLWIDIAARKTQSIIGAGINVLITDVRFENEAEWVRDSGGMLWHVDRDSSVVDSHKSEAGVKFVKGDVRIYNNETLGWLFDGVDILAKKLLKEQAEQAATEENDRKMFLQSFGREKETVYNA